MVCQVWCDLYSALTSTPLNTLGMKLNAIVAKGALIPPNFDGNPSQKSEVIIRAQEEVNVQRKYGCDGQTFGHI